MPTPVACLLNSPLMTLIFVFSGSSGSRLLPSSIVRARALGPPVVGLTPLPMNSDGEPLRATAAAGRRRRAPDGQRFQPRQRHRHAGAAEERPPGRIADSLHRSARHGHVPRDVAGARRLFRNWGW